MVFAQAADICCAKHLRLNCVTSHSHDWKAYETSLPVHLSAYETPCDDSNAMHQGMLLCRGSRDGECFASGGPCTAAVSCMCCEFTTAMPLPGHCAACN